MLPLTDFNKFCTENELFHPEDKLLLAVSGGKDSVLMTYLFYEAELNFGIAHCNFQLRGKESEDDALFVEELSRNFSVPFHTACFETLDFASQNHISIQMAARELRYEWFEKMRRAFGYTYIAVAHHSNDASETILLNLVRGTGIAGMHGILPKRNKIIRPMLFLSREQIDQIVNKEHIPYREDSSNSSTKYARNKIRHEVIPKLKEINPKLEDTFIENSNRFVDLELFLNLQIEELRKELFKKNGDVYYINLIKLKDLKPQRLILYELFKPFGFRENVLNDLIISWDGQPGKRFESSDYQLILDRNQLILQQRIGEDSADAFILLNDRRVYWNNKQVSVRNKEKEELPDYLNPNLAYIDSSKLEYPLKLTSWKESNYFYPYGMKGSKKLSDYFISLKIPRHEKKNIPLLFNGNGEIIWVAGYRVDNRYKINSLTEKVTIFELQNDDRE